jgi:FkbM family methyltransferase
MIGKLLRTLRWAANHPVSHGAKWNGMYRFAAAQVGARMTPGDVCVPFPNNSSLLIPPWMKGAAHFIWPSLVEFDEMSFFMHFLRAEELFVDVGANIGAFTVLAGAVAGARTLSFEPGPLAYSFLVKNIHLNNLTGRAIPRNIALGRSQGTVSFTAGLGTENYVVQGKSELEVVTVEQSTLDIQTRGLEPVAMKIDVEGFEKEVLAGADEFLRKPSLHAMIMERVGNAGRFGQDESPLHEYVRSLSFVPCAYEALTRTLRRVPDTAEGNIIYVRDLEKAGARLRAAQAWHFGGKTV